MEVKVKTDGCDAPTSTSTTSSLSSAFFDSAPGTPTVTGNVATTLFHRSNPSHYDSVFMAWPEPGFHRCSSVKKDGTLPSHTQR